MTEPKTHEIGPGGLLTTPTIEIIYLRELKINTAISAARKVAQAQREATLAEVREKVEGLELVAPVPLGPLFGVGWSACLKAVKAKLEKVKE